MSQNVFASLINRARVGTALLMLILRGFFPKALNEFVLFHFYGIKLHIEKEESFDDVSVCKFKYGTKSAFCVSMDFEIPIPKRLELARISQQAIDELLEIAEFYNVPVTWAVCGNILAKPSTYRDSFEQIVASCARKGRHELASHTFSHVDLSSCSEEVAKQEILAGSKALRGFMRPTSFVFPYEKEEHHGVLAKHGFTAYRGATAMLGYPRKIYNMWHVYPTYFFSGRASNLAAFSLQILLQCLVDLAVKYGCVLHIWSHPWGMDIRKDARRFNEKVLRPLFSYVAKKREKELVWVCTMQELANYCESRKNCMILKYERADKEVSVAVRCEIKNVKFDFLPIVTIKIPIPIGKHVSRVYVDENELKHSVICHVAKHGKKSLVLTLTFEKPVKKIRVLTNN